MLLDAGAAGQADESIAMAHQLRTLSARRLSARLGTLVDAGLRHQLPTAIRV